LKYCIIVEPGVDPKLATATLFDLLGDPSLWLENHAILFWAREEKGIAEWAEEINDALSGPITVAESWNPLNDEWIVLGPTVEDFVEAATATGAKYLALDDGLVELAIEPEPEEVPVVPDIEDPAEAQIQAMEDPANEPKEEPVAEVLPEVPATPKRRQSRAKKPAVKAEPDPVDVAQEAAKELSVEKGPIEGDSSDDEQRYGTVIIGGDPKTVSTPYGELPVIDPDTFDPMVESSREALGTAREGRIVYHLRELAHAYVSEASEKDLWGIIDSLRE
jgi:hypothetical protein